MSSILSHDEIKALLATSRGLLSKEPSEHIKRTNDPSKRLVRRNDGIDTSVEIGALMTDVEGRVLWVNEGFLQMTGFFAGELIGQIPQILFSDRKKKVLNRSLWETVLGGRVFNGIFSDQKKSGSRCNFDITITPVQDPSGKITSFLQVWKDVTTRVQQDETLWRQAHIDSLTGLPNRSILSHWIPDAISRAKRQGSQIAILFLDLDGFKEVNDKFGHSGGDLLLKVIAKRLLGCVRITDLVVRLGGDEFVMLVDSDGKKGMLTSFVDRLMVNISRLIAIESKIIRVTASIGVSLCPQDGDVCEELLRKSDAAMYQAKAQGKNKWKFFDEI